MPWRTRWWQRWPSIMLRYEMIKFGRPVPDDFGARLPDVVEKLAEDERIRAVWLFGSRARGEADALSDVDLAVLVRPDALASLWDGQLEWTALATALLGTDEVAVQALNRMPVALRHAILRDARLLFARSDEEVSDFLARTDKEYIDLKPHLNRYDRELLRQAAAGTLR